MYYLCTVIRETVIQNTQHSPCIKIHANSAANHLFLYPGKVCRHPTHACWPCQLSNCITSKLALRSDTSGSINSHPRAPVPPLPCRLYCAVSLFHFHYTCGSLQGMIGEGFFVVYEGQGHTESSTMNSRSISRFEMEMDCVVVRV